MLSAPGTAFAGRRSQGKFWILIVSHKRELLATSRWLLAQAFSGRGNARHGNAFKGFEFSCKSLHLQEVSSLGAGFDYTTQRE